MEMVGIEPYYSSASHEGIIPYTSPKKMCPQNPSKDIPSMDQPRRRPDASQHPWVTPAALPYHHTPRVRKRLHAPLHRLLRLLRALIFCQLHLL